MGAFGAVLALCVAAALLAPAGAAAAAAAPDGDDPAARAALLRFGAALGAGPGLPPARPGQAGWGAPNVSYCAWRGVACCGAAAALLPAPCGSAREVVALNLTAAGLAGGLPPEGLGAMLAASLQVLLLAHNPGLRGAWPAALAPPRLALLDVRVGGLRATRRGGGGAAG
jgi:hypothetical protein